MSGRAPAGIRHVVCLTWALGTDPEVIDTVTRELGRLPAQIPEIRAYSCGIDIGLAEGNGDFAIVADFDDEEGWRRYQEHPAHVAVLTEWIRPHLGTRTAVQLRIAPVAER